MITHAIRDVLSEIEEHIVVVAALKAELLELRSEQFFTCPLPACGKRTKVKSTPLISKYFYTHTNAGAGSYWSFSEHQIVCPKCDRILRAKILPKDFIREHIGSFREEVNWYPSGHDRWDTAEDLIAQCREK